MRRLVGYDLNGWRDWAVRNWLEQPGEDVAEKAEHIVSGGVGGVVVRHIDRDRGGLLVGGVQALRAPHGMGPGWGEIGSRDRRRLVADILAEPEANLEEIAASLRGMADPGGLGSLEPTTAVLAIPDVAAPETEQEALLQALRMIRTTSDSLLVWRPVLACLAALDQGKIDESRIRREPKVGIVGHAAKGLTSQRLFLHKDKEQAPWTPERRETGNLHAWEGGLEDLRRRARNILGDAYRTPAGTDELEASRLLAPLALGETPCLQASRRDKGNWEFVAPMPLPPELPRVPSCLLDRLRDCETIILETPAVGAVRRDLIHALSHEFRTSIHPLDPRDIARGAFIAARRIARGEPVYFDFLPQLSTIVRYTEGHRNFDLIPRDARLPAGQIYRSREPAQLGLSKDMDRIKVYLKKQQSDACRLAEVPLPAPAQRDCTVTLDVEQAPAAGRARLTLNSDAFPVPLHVDWDSAGEVEESWEELIERLNTHGIPNRVILPCGLDVWHGLDGQEGLETVLRRSAKCGRYDWAELARLMSARYDGRYPISSDGSLPDGLREGAKDALEAATDEAEKHVIARLEGRTRDNNDSLRFLTWQFRRCRDSVVEPMIKALKAPTGNHVLVRRGGNRQLIYHGLGRIVDDERTQDVLDWLLHLEPRSWKRDQIACAAHLLSRTEFAPKNLTRPKIERLGKVVLYSNKRVIGGRYTSRYIYTPFLMVGLLRVRLVDRWALVAQRDTLADKLLKSTKRVVADMTDRFPEDARIGRYRDVLEEACDWLRGEGRHPDILSILQQLSTTETPS